MLAGLGRDVWRLVFSPGEDQLAVMAVILMEVHDLLETRLPSGYVPQLLSR